MTTPNTTTDQSLSADAREYPDDILRREFSFDGHGINIDGQRFATIQHNPISGAGPSLITGDGDHDWRYMTMEEIEEVAKNLADLPEILREHRIMRNALSAIVKALDVRSGRPYISWDEPEAQMAMSAVRNQTKKR